MAERLVAIRYPKIYHNMYKVSDSGGKFWVYHATGTLFTSLRSLGTTRSLSDALELVKADLGTRDVRWEIRDW